MYKRLGIKTVTEGFLTSEDEREEVLPDEKNNEKLLDINTAN
jgi:hypothetical protein